MTKLNLIVSFDSNNSFFNPAFSQAIIDYFNIVNINDVSSINKNDSVLVVNCMDIINKRPLWCQQYYDKGFKILIDTLWCSGDHSFYNAFNLSTINFFWYYESLLASYNGYQHYKPNKTYIKTGLMPMGLIKQSHEMLYEAMIPYLDNFYFSYVERLEKYLPFDADPLFPVSAGRTGQQQRYFNPRWYDDTYFSLVSETTVNDQDELHITEKTFKPIAYNHPFLLWAQPGVLQHLKSLGFVSYDNLFDESYDNIMDLTDRLRIIINNVKNFQHVPYDTVTLEKIQHNRNLFFNNEIIKQRIMSEIVLPILDWFESKQ